MFRSGVVKTVINNGVLEALLAAGKEEVVVALLRGPMLEVRLQLLSLCYRLWCLSKIMSGIVKSALY